MDESDSKSFHKNILPLVLGVLGLLFFGYGLMSLNAPKKDKPDILFEAAADKREIAEITPEEKEIIVDVAGAVMRPGVYKLTLKSRMQDALVAAGGMNEEADRERVAKTLNLAAKVTDGAKIYIPFVGEEIVTSQDSSNTEVIGESSESMNINDASAEALEGLPGIGEVTAAKIIENRPYSSIQELLDKKIVGKSTFDKIRDKVRVN